MNRRTVLVDRDPVDARMAELCWDVPELARQSGVHRITVGGILRGDYHPSRATIRKLARALGVEPSEITRIEVAS